MAGSDLSGPAVDPASLAPVPEHHHRDVHGGTARAAVFGASDGLLTNISLILGVAGANPGPGFVRLAGLTGLVAGAVSMASGEYLSMRAQSELLEHELDMERIELRRNPHVETVELTQIYQSRGMDPDHARQLAEEMMRDPEIALQTHAREELGINPESLGSPVGAAAASLVSFALAALVPLLPWFFASGTAAVVTSIVLGFLAAIALGVGLARFTARSAVFSACRQVGIAAAAATFTFVVGRLVGTGVG